MPTKFKTRRAKSFKFAFLLLHNSSKTQNSGHDHDDTNDVKNISHIISPLNYVGLT